MPNPISFARNRTRRRRPPNLPALLLACASLSGFVSPAQAAEALFREAAEETGLAFRHFTGATGAYLTPEIMGSGVALLDYDGDGDLDVYLLQGTILESGKSSGDALFPPPKEHWPGNRLFRNELVESGKLRFTDVTEQAHVAGNGTYAMGVAVGDYDNDGDPDLFVSNFGANLLYRNNGDGTFSDVTKKAGVGDGAFGASAAFVDYDRDGDLDLFVTRYFALTVAGNRACYNDAGARDYCGPGEYPPLPDRLYRNDGNGRFVDVTRESGIGAAFGNGLGVVSADFNGDGWPDIYVANDKTPNQLWINQHNGRFEDQALISGCAYNGDARAEAGMGITAADFDGDGDEDLFVTHLRGETNTLYVNDGSGLFDDTTSIWGLAHTSVPFTSFGTLWFDYDNDGRLDLFIANGEVKALHAAADPRFPYAQTNQLFHNNGSAFEETTERGGPDFQRAEVSRGAAFGDIDNDGDIDIVVSNANGPVRLLLNETGSRRHWLLVRLEATSAQRDAYGARVGLIRKGKPVVWRRAGADGSYLSANDPRIHFGLGEDVEAAKPEKLVVVWPGGSRESFGIGETDRVVTLRKGQGRAEESAAP